MSDREKVIKSLSELIEQREMFASTDRFVSSQDSDKCQYWFSRVVSLMDSISPEKSFYNQEVRHLISRSNRQGGIYQEDIQRIVGHLSFLRDAVNDGLLLKIEDAITASDYSDFLDYARSYYDAQQKIQAAVIASAVFEDVIRRIGRRHGLSGQESLETVINSLKSSSVITKNEAKKLKYYAGIRNSALHASWAEFDLSDAGDLIKGTQSLIDQFLSDSIT